MLYTIVANSLETEGLATKSISITVCKVCPPYSGFNQQVILQLLCYHSNHTHLDVNDASLIQKVALEALAIALAYPMMM